MNIHIHIEDIRAKVSEIIEESKENYIDDLATFIMGQIEFAYMKGVNDAYSKVLDKFKEIK